jgi:hypothetical protein
VASIYVLVITHNEHSDLINGWNVVTVVVSLGISDNTNGKIARINGTQYFTRVEEYFGEGVAVT